MNYVVQRILAVVGVGAAIGLVFTGAGGAVVCGVSSLITGGLVLYGSRNEPSGGLTRAIQVAAVTSLLLSFATIYGQR